MQNTKASGLELILQKGNKKSEDRRWKTEENLQNEELKAVNIG